jgi:hypothetical protein
MKRTNLLIFVIILMGLVSVPSVSALSVVVHVPEKYTSVQPGERLYFEIEITYPENPERKDLRLDYEVLTQKGELVAQSKVLKAVETQASFMDFIVMPETAKKGLYAIKVKIADYENLSEDVEASFQVTGGSGDQLKLYFFILLGVVTLIGILVIATLILEAKRNNEQRK